MSKFKYFKLEDFDCQETGDNEMDVEFIHKLDQLREACGFPFIITSGFRSKDHSIEKRKEKAGTHAQGIAADIRARNGNERYKIVQEAIKLGFTGVGIARTFIHVDSRIVGADKAPVMWCY
jgi:zinc D-Ala-D-Ala carboxypeptidase